MKLDSIYWLKGAFLLGLSCLLLKLFPYYLIGFEFISHFLISVTGVLAFSFAHLAFLLHFLNLFLWNEDKQKLDFNPKEPDRIGENGSLLLSSSIFVAAVLTNYRLSLTFWEEVSLPEFLAGLFLLFLSFGAKKDHLTKPNPSTKNDQNS